MDTPTLAVKMQAALRECPHLKRCNVFVMELPNTIVLGGSVSSFYQKQMAQETILKYLKLHGFMMALENKISVSTF